MDTVLIKDLREVNHLCRICLTESKQMINLYSKLEERVEKKVKFLYQMLCKVMDTNIIAYKSYPSFICPLCLSILNLSYKLKLQFKKSQTLLEEYFANTQVKTETVELENSEDERKAEPAAPVELITNNGKYDINDLIIVEEEKGDMFQFDGFLKNLGSEISAVFVDERKRNAKSEKTNGDNSLSIIIKVQEEDFEDMGLMDEQPLDANPPIKEKKQNSFSCNTCGKIFAYSKYLKRHIKDIHCKKDDEEYLCQLCGHMGKTKSALYHHTVSKHQERKFTCEECGKKFISVGHYNQHKIVHANPRSYLCNICGKSFNYSNALEYHLRTHTGEKKYKCLYCERRFTMPCSLKRHMRTHTGLRPYQCKYCEKAFRSKGEVNCHEMLHTGYRPYHCKHCGKGFTKTHNLKIHLLAHTGPHGCELCPKTFIEMDYLKTHMKISHSKEPLAYEPNEEEDMVAQEFDEIELEELGEIDDVAIHKVNDDLLQFENSDDLYV